MWQDQPTHSPQHIITASIPGAALTWGSATRKSCDGSVSCGAACADAVPLLVAVTAPSFEPEAIGGGHPTCAGKADSFVNRLRVTRSPPCKARLSSFDVASGQLLHGRSSNSFATKVHCRQSPLQTADVAHLCQPLLQRLLQAAVERVAACPHPPDRALGVLPQHLGLRVARQAIKRRRLLGRRAKSADGLSRAAASRHCDAHCCRCAQTFNCFLTSAASSTKEWSKLCHCPATSVHYTDMTSHVVPCATQLRVPPYRACRNTWLCAGPGQMSTA